MVRMDSVTWVLTFSDCKYYIWILSRKRSLCLFQLILGFLKLIIQRWCARSSRKKPKKNEYSLDLFQPRRYQKTTSRKSCSAFSLKRKGKKTMQDDLTDFQRISQQPGNASALLVQIHETGKQPLPTAYRSSFQKHHTNVSWTMHQDRGHLYKTQSEQQKAAARKHRARVPVDQICFNSNHNILKFPPATAKFS